MCTQAGAAHAGELGCLPDLAGAGCAVAVGCMQNWIGGIQRIGMAHEAASAGAVPVVYRTVRDVSRLYDLRICLIYVSDGDRTWTAGLLSSSCAGNVVGQRLG